MDQTAIVITNSPWGETSDTPCAWVRCPRLVQHSAHVDNIHPTFHHMHMHVMGLWNEIIKLCWRYSSCTFVLSMILLMIGMTPPYSSELEDILDKVKEITANITHMEGDTEYCWLTVNTFWNLWMIISGYLLINNFYIFDWF